MTNATNPKAMIIRVSRVKNWSAVIFTDMVSPSNMDTRLTRSFCAELLNRSSTPHSLSKFPNIKNPTRGKDTGAINPATIDMMIGNSIFVFFDTLDALYVILIARSFLVVTSFMANGCMMGTKAI